MEKSSPNPAAVSRSSNHSSSQKMEHDELYMESATNLFAVVIVFIVVFCMGFLFLAEYFHEPPPVYLMYEYEDYSYQLNTHCGAKFYVNSTIWFDANYAPNSDIRADIEKKINLEFKSLLMKKCVYEIERGGVENTHCEEFNHFSNGCVAEKMPIPKAKEQECVIRTRAEQLKEQAA